jgi:hypothetical protein
LWFRESDLHTKPYKLYLQFILNLVGRSIGKFFRNRLVSGGSCRFRISSFGENCTFIHSILTILCSRREGHWLPTDWREAVQQVTCSWGLWMQFWSLSALPKCAKFVTFQMCHLVIYNLWGFRALVRRNKERKFLICPYVMLRRPHATEKCRRSCRHCTGLPMRHSSL